MSVRSSQCRFVSEPKDKPEAVFESKPLFADRLILSPLPEVQDFFARKHLVPVDIKLRQDLRSEEESRRFGLSAAVPSCVLPSRPKDLLEESFEDIPNGRQQVYEEAVSSLSPKKRVQPIIAPRPSGLRPLMQQLLH
jgi:hypothetical protein